jgi:heat-inducible transcriptional repressor
MAELTDRQTKILKVIIGEYMETGEPVGSETLEKKYELGVSPATIRSEMAKLTKAGFLRQRHTSAGRIPTKQAFKLYIDRLMEEKELSVADEVAAKEEIWDARFDFDQLLHQTVKALAQKTQMLALAQTNQGDLYHAGYANILSLPEFWDIDVTRSVLSLLDEANQVEELFGRAFGEGPIHCLLGDELGAEYFQPCGMVFAHFDAGKKRSGSLGVIGPTRLDYSLVVPLVRYFNDLVEELSRNL